MLVLTLFVLGCAGFWVLAFHKAHLRTWIVGSGLWLLVVTLFAGGLSFLLSIIWLGWLFVALCNHPPFRMHFVSGPLFSLYRRLLPDMSDTEREALEAGSVWWDGELFSGKPDWRRMRDLPAPSLSDDEQAFLDGPTEELCGMLNDWQITHELHDLPLQVWEFIRSQGFLGMIIPKDYGGLGFSALAHSSIVMKIASRSTSTAVSVMVPNSLGPAELLMRYGTDDQKQHYLPRLASGQELPCFALTGPTAGSDASSIPDRAVICMGTFQRKKVLGLRVTWEKRYITLGPVATLLGLAFRTFDPDHLLGEEEDLGITLAMIPTSHRGVKIGRRHFPGKQAFQNGPTSGTNVFIPMDWVIGKQERVGHGWRMLMNCLAAGRSISLPAIATAAGKFYSRTTGTYSRVRKQFKTPIGRFEGIEEPLARMAGHAYGIEAARRMTAIALDNGHEPSVISALLKYQSTERQREVINDAMDVHGGRAICEGPSNYISNAYQALPVSITVEGANILTRSLIVFGQGAIRCHPWLFKEMQAAKNENRIQGLHDFDRAIAGHIRFMLSNAGRAAFHNLTAGRCLSAPVNGPQAKWYRHLHRASTNFALVADAALLLLGGEFKRREKLSGRFADILGEMYFISAVLKRYEDDGCHPEDMALVKWVCLNSLYTIQERFDAILHNFPSRLVAWKLRWIIFPLGKRWRPVDDALGHRLASILLEPSAQRDRLTEGIYIGKDRDDITGCLEYAMKLVIESDVLDARIRRAIRDGRLQVDPLLDLVEQAEAQSIISTAEAELLKETERAVRRAIDVDDFAPAELHAQQIKWRDKSISLVKADKTKQDG